MIAGFHAIADDIFFTLFFFLMLMRYADATPRLFELRLLFSPP